jgi:hypothetical protein
MPLCAPLRRWCPVPFIMRDVALRPGLEPGRRHAQFPFAVALGAADTDSLSARLPFRHLNMVRATGFYPAWLVDVVRVVQARPHN